MSAPVTAQSVPTASYSLANWQRMQLGELAQETSEAMLFTDTWVTGEVPKVGPYAFINTIAHAYIQPSKVIRPAIAMRVTHHYRSAPDKPALPMENDYDHYHGGDYLDEMAALASLFLGIRLKAGGANRQFYKDGDPLGRPIQYGGKPDPQLVLEGRPQIPRLALPVNLNAGLEVLNVFPDRSVKQTNALIKAARQYQQAVWIADSDPALAWLMLVSAIETAAVEWKGDVTPIEQLETAHPQLVDLVRKSKSPELLEPLASALKDLTKSTKRFVDFVLAFAPPPPAGRPELYMQFSYEKPAVKKAATLIYRHRSKHLHNGTAIPLPMCEPPQFKVIGEGVIAVQETPLGLAMTSKNASWKVGDTPMLLNTFEHIARGSLVNWWKSLSSSPNSSS